MSRPCLAWSARLNQSCGQMLMGLVGMQGTKQIAELVAHARQLQGFSVMAGGGIRPDNVARILSETGVTEIHSSASR